jgi:Rrf2 family protein
MISKKTKYAISAVVYLAGLEHRNPVLISEISKERKIPQKFLEAILLDLRRAGILSSKKGKGGGYYLLKSAEEINLAEILRLFDGPIALLPCVSLNYYEKCEDCVDEEHCGIRDAFLKVRKNTLDLLKQSTVANIVEKEKNK